MVCLLVATVAVAGYQPFVCIMHLLVVNRKTLWLLVADGCMHARGSAAEPRKRKRRMQAKVMQRYDDEEEMLSTNVSEFVDQLQNFFLQHFSYIPTFGALLLSPDSVDGRVSFCRLLLFFNSFPSFALLLGIVSTSPRRYDLPHYISEHIVILRGFCIHCRTKPG